MKKLFTLCVIIAMTISVAAQLPQKMSYQAVVRNISGVLQANQAVGMKISILQGSATGTSVYVETQTKTTNANGLVTLEIGSGTIVSGTFSGIDWSNGTYFIKTETDPTGGTNYTVTGTSQILSVPFALYAKTAKTADYNDLTNRPSLFDGTWTSLTGKPSFAPVATSGSYNDLTNRPTLFDGSWSGITAKPTTITGFGITDAISTSHIANSITSTMITSWNTAYGWGNHSGLYKLNSYVPAWVEITGKPTFATVATSGTFADLLSKPTTLAGYGITNAISTSHTANSITSTMMTNWNTAFSWGNHAAGLYRPITYVPAWTEITSKPTTLSGYEITDAVTTSGNQTISGNKTFTGTTQVITPVNATDAANKVYVDGLKQQIKDLEDIVFTQLPLPTDGLIAYYPFNGNANDESVNDNYGTVVGVTLTNDRLGKSNSAYSFNGTSNNKITVDFTTPLSTSEYSGITISAWCKLNTLNEPPYNILSLLDNSLKGFLITYDPTQTKFYVAKSITPLQQFTSMSTLNLVDANMWYNLVITFDTNTNIFKFYLNDVLQGQATFDAFMPTVTNLYIGYHNSETWGLGWWMNGFIDDIRIYHRTLSEAEIRLLYHEGGYTESEIVTDIDGNVYNTVKIGNQWWMAENLKATNYNDGTLIPNVTNNLEWSNLTTPGYCWFNNDEAAYKYPHGAYYNWYTVNTSSNGNKNVCLLGWHVPSQADWNIMINYLIANGYNYDGSTTGNKIAKSLGSTTTWRLSPYVGAIGNSDYPAYRNKTGFTAFSSGNRYPDGPFTVYPIGCGVWWWIPEKDINDAPVNMEMREYSVNLYVWNNHPNFGFNIRCVKD